MIASPSPGKPAGPSSFCAPAEQARLRPWLLIVDDETAFVDALRFRLETRGIASLAASRGQEALNLLPQTGLEVVLLDLNMPGQHGLETLRLMKARQADLEVVLLTGEADFSTAARGMRRGAGDYLLKPVDFDALLESLAKARTRAREHRDRLRAAEAGKLIALGALAAGVGHEINNPLQIILQRSEWLQELVQEAADGPPDLAEMSKTAGVIKAQAARAGTITAQLLDLAHRSRSGRVRSNLATLAAKIGDMFRERAAALGTELTLSIGEDVPELPCSPAELEPVLLHLVRNALDAVEADGVTDGTQDGASGEAKDVAAAAPVRVSLRAVRDGFLVRLEVEDNGEGISEEHASQVFEPFFSTRPVGRGTGLGLTVCHSIITALRGDIYFTSAVGAGTTFIVEIPLADEPA